MEGEMQTGDSAFAFLVVAGAPPPLFDALHEPLSHAVVSFLPFRLDLFSFLFVRSLRAFQSIFLLEFQ